MQTPSSGIRNQVTDSVFYNNNRCIKYATEPTKYKQAH